MSRALGGIGTDRVLQALRGSRRWKWRRTDGCGRRLLRLWETTQLFATSTLLHRGQSYEKWRLPSARCTRERFFAPRAAVTASSRCPRIAPHHPAQLLPKASPAPLPHRECSHHGGQGEASEKPEWVPAASGDKLIQIERNQSAQTERTDDERNLSTHARPSAWVNVWCTSATYPAMTPRAIWMAQVSTNEPPGALLRGRTRSRGVGAIIGCKLLMCGCRVNEEGTGLLIQMVVCGDQSRTVGRRGCPALK